MDELSLEMRGVPDTLTQGEYRPGVPSVAHDYLLLTIVGFPLCQQEPRGGGRLVSTC